MFRAITRHEDVLALVRRRKPDVVSFDLFDTLLYRTVCRPTDVFLMQARRLRRAGLIDIAPSQWLARRTRTERQIAKSARPGGAGLAQIYEALFAAGEFASSEARDRAMALELEIEREVARLFPFVPALLEAVKATGARVVVLSDIYLPSPFIRELLAPVAGWIDELHCSCDAGKTKRHGEAYALLKNRGRVLHFGDNRDSDRWRAWRNGIDGRLIAWERQRWLDRNRAEMSLLNLRGLEVPPLPDQGRPPVPGSLEDLAVRWSIVLYDFLLDLRRQARLAGATDIWLASRDTESLWAVLRDHPEFFGQTPVRYVRVSRKATRPLMALVDPERYARWWGRWEQPVTPEVGLLAQRFYGSQLRPETRRILFVDMISRGRLEVSLRMALPPSITVSGFYFSLLESEASCESRVYLPWRHDLFSGTAVEMLSGYSEGTLLGFRDNTAGTIEPVLDPDPPDTAPRAYVDNLRSALRRLIEAGAEAGEREEPDTSQLLAARCDVVCPLTMFPDSAVASSLRGWHYSSPHSHPAHDVVNPRDPLIRRLFGIASRDNRWPSVALHSVAPAWLVPALQWLAVGRMKIKNRLDGIGPLQSQTMQLVEHDDRG